MATRSISCPTISACSMSGTAQVPITMTDAEVVAYDNPSTAPSFLGAYERFDPLSLVFDLENSSTDTVSVVGGFLDVANSARDGEPAVQVRPYPRDPCSGPDRLHSQILHRQFRLDLARQRLAQSQRRLDRWPHCRHPGHRAAARHQGHLRSQRHRSAQGARPRCRRGLDHQAPLLRSQRRAALPRRAQAVRPFRPARQFHLARLHHCRWRP